MSSIISVTANAAVTRTTSSQEALPSLKEAKERFALIQDILKTLPDPKIKQVRLSLSDSLGRGIVNPQVYSTLKTLEQRAGLTQTAHVSTAAPQPTPSVQTASTTPKISKEDMQSIQGILNQKVQEDRKNKTNRFPKSSELQPAPIQVSSVKIDPVQTKISTAISTAPKTNSPAASVRPITAQISPAPISPNNSLFTAQKKPTSLSPKSYVSNGSMYLVERTNSKASSTRDALKVGNKETPVEKPSSSGFFASLLNWIRSLFG